MQVPCGTCILCRQEQGRQMAVMIFHESRQHETSSFLTLTYSDEKLPEHGSLRYKDLQDFWKRLRKKHALRYFACGEYGDKTLRPHYHACVFGLDWAEGSIELAPPPRKAWTHPDLEAAWGLGQVSVGPLNFETASYTASYVLKKLHSKQQYVRTDAETGELIALEQPRRFHSNGLARSWWEQYRAGVADQDHVVIAGRRQKPPAAYDRWLGEVDERRREEIKAKRKEFTEQLRPEQRDARAREAHARAKSRSKSV